MKKILFVCHGNICRSPMAELVMKTIVAELDMQADFLIDSAATSGEEVGNPVYPPAQKILRDHGIDPTGKRARQLREADYGDYDLLVGMDSANVQNMLRLFGGDPDNKVSRLLDRSDIADPWYTGDFQRTWKEVNEGCLRLLAREL